jgi:hypothetical protein
MERRKRMVDLKRKVIALLLALVFVAGTVAISGCKKDSGTAKPKTPSRQKLPEE